MSISITMLHALPARLLIPNSFTLRLALFLSKPVGYSCVSIETLLVALLVLLRGAGLTCSIHNGLSIQFVFCGMVGTKEWTAPICSLWWDTTFELYFRWFKVCMAVNPWRSSDYQGASPDLEWSVSSKGVTVSSPNYCVPVLPKSFWPGLRM